MWIVSEGIWVFVFYFTVAQNPALLQQLLANLPPALLQQMAGGLGAAGAQGGPAAQQALLQQMLANPQMYASTSHHPLLIN